MPVTILNTGTFNGTGTSAPAGLAAASGAGSAASMFVLGTTKPDATNTGYAMAGYTSGSLTDNTPASPGYLYTISANNTVVQGLRIHGRVVITGNNCTLKGCHIVGHLNMAYSSPYGLVNSSGTGNTIDSCEISLWDTSASTDNSAGFNGSTDTYWPVGVYMTTGSCTVSRCDIHDVNDATYCIGGTHTVQGCYLHDPMFRNDDGDQSGSSPAYWSHNDGFQIMGGTGHVCNGNAFDWKFSDNTGMNRSGTGTVGSFGSGNPNPSSTAEQVWVNGHGVILQTYNAAVSNVTISNNWFRYGSCPIRFTPGNFDPGGAVTVTGNRFTPDQGVEFSQYVQIRIDPVSSWNSPAPTIDSTNVYSSDSDTPSGARGTTISALTGTSVKISAYSSSAHTGNVPLSLTP